MNTYLYAWHTDTECSITKVIARNYDDCKQKIIKSFCDELEDLDDLLEFNDFCEQLGDNYGIYIGTIYEIDEFM